MEDALVDFVMTGKLNFKNLANSIIADMARIAIQQTITMPFSNFLKGIFSKNANGNTFVDGKVQKYAYGGIVKKPTIFPMANGMGLMGEAGAEAILPLRRGSNGKLGVQSTGGSIGNIVVNVDASGSSVEGDEQRGKELGRLISTAVQSELIQQKRPGGLLA
jgi:phage-related minor tail protein